jgi:hypothetical protein
VVQISRPRTDIGSTWTDMEALTGHLTQWNS